MFEIKIRFRDGSIERYGVKQYSGGDYKLECKGLNRLELDSQH